jgi:hypothetical protein
MCDVLAFLAKLERSWAQESGSAVVERLVDQPFC